MNEVVIVSAARTAGGRIGGSLKDVQPEDLAKVVIVAAIERAGVEPEAIDEVIIGQAKQSADAANLARVAALRAGLPVEVPAYTVMRQCGSGLQAVNNAAQAIMCGLADIVVAGGTESMSNAPLLSERRPLRLPAPATRCWSTPTPRANRGPSLSRSTATSPWG